MSGPVSPAWPLPRPPRRWQPEALAAVLAAVRARRPAGIEAPCGSGKSELLAAVVALAAPRATEANDAIVILTSRQELVRQLSRTLAAALPGVSVGTYYADAKAPDARVVVACNASALRALSAVGRPLRLVVTDECHRVGPYVDAILAARPAAVVGVSACLRPNELLPEITYTYTHAAAVADGALVPYRVRTATPAEAYGGVPPDDVLVRWVREAVASAGAGLVYARSIPDAESFAGLLGPSAAVVHSRSRRSDVTDALAGLADGRVRTLVNVDMLVEGWDLPALGWVMLRRPSMSTVQLVQAPGRACRTAPGKTHALVLDPYDLVRAPPGVDVGGWLTEQARGDGSAERSPPVPALPPLVAVEFGAAWCREVLGVLVEAGVVPPPDLRTGIRGGWPTQRDLAALWRLGRFASWLPETVRDGVKGLWSAACGVPWAREPEALASDAELRCGLDAGSVREIATLLEAARRGAAAAMAERARTGPRRGAGNVLRVPSGVALPELPAGVLDGLGEASEPERRAAK